MRRNIIVLALGILIGSALCCMSPREAAAKDTPESLEPPANQALLLAAHGAGVQIYECVASKADAAQFAWSLRGPEAQLHDDSGKTVGKHYAGPTWEANDGSTVVGEVVAHDESADAAAIPWLLLRAKSTSGHGLFGAVQSIQRLHTSGGKAPSSGCDQSHAGTESRVAYSADYVFYTAKPDSTSPLGVWKTFDDKTGNARAIVRIYEKDGKLFGKIEQSFTPGAESRVCAVCTDDRKNQPIIGLVIVRNMSPDGGEFSGGDILDPESGSVYHCKMHVEREGTRLIVRGYIGFSLLGRSQTWQRQS